LYKFYLLLLSDFIPVTTLRIARSCWSQDDQLSVRQKMPQHW